MVQHLLEQPTVDAGALDSAGRSPLDDVEAMLERTGDAGLEARLQTVAALLAEADLMAQIQRQVTDGVSVEEGQRVRDYMQSLVRGPVEDFWPKVMISYATGTRDLKRGYECDLDGDGCGLGMQYANLLARALDRGGISCFSGLHVAGGQNWRQVSENNYVCCSEIKLEQF